MNETMSKEMKAGAGISCVVGFVGTESAAPVAGTPLAVGDCAVRAVEGGLTASGVFVVSNAGDIWSLGKSEAKAVAQVSRECF